MEQTTNNQDAFYYVHDRRAENNAPYVFTGTLKECQQYINDNKSPYLSPRKIQGSSTPTMQEEKEGFTGGWKVINWGQRAQIRDENNNEVCTILPNAMPFDTVIDNGIPTEETTALAKRIVTCVNNFDDMYEALKKAAMEIWSKGNSEHANEIQAIINRIENQ